MVKSVSNFIDEYKGFWGLLIFGNIENLIIGSQGAIYHLDPFIVAILSLIMVVIWFLIGTYGTKAAVKYERVIEFIGGLAIFILGLQSMLGAVGI